MNALNQKWTRRTAELHLPQPRTITIRGQDTGPANTELLKLHKKASKFLGDPHQHLVTRFDAVSDYSSCLGKYVEILGTCISTADAGFYQQYDSLSDDERLVRIHALLSRKTTRTPGLAAALLKPTLFAGLAAGLTAFAIKDNSRRSFNTASTALSSVDRLFAEYDELVASAS